MKCSVYARTIEFFHDFMVKEKESIDFFHKLGFLISCFLLFFFSYNFYLSLDENHDNLNLVNPLQVVAQLCCFLFYFKSKRSDVRERHLILLCFIFSIMGTIYLKGINFGLHFYIIFLLSILIYIKDFDYVPLVVLLFYSLDVGLAKWGFYLLFQQVAYYALSISLDKDQAIPQNRVIFAKIFLLTIQLLIGTFVYKDFYFKEPAKLAVLLSGASILFLCMNKRSRFAFLLSFFIYFIISIIIGLVSLPGKVTALDLWGLSIFVLVHIIFLWGLQLFILPQEKQSIVPFLFYALLYLLPYFPHLKWISKWIQGFDLLLFLLCFLYFIEESRASHGRRTIQNTKNPVR